MELALSGRMVGQKFILLCLGLSMNPTEKAGKNCSCVKYIPISLVSKQLDKIASLGRQAPQSTTKWVKILQLRKSKNPKM